MQLKILLTAVAASALMSGAAFAQPAEAPAAPVNPTTSATPAPSPDPVAPTDQAAPAEQPAAPTSTTATPPAADTGAATSTSVTASDPATGTSVTSTLTTNGPVPDTAENRAKYGGPMSHAGKRTAAKGN